MHVLILDSVCIQVPVFSAVVGAPVSRMGDHGPMPYAIAAVAASAFGIDARARWNKFFAEKEMSDPPPVSDVSAVDRPRVYELSATELFARELLSDCSGARDSCSERLSQCDDYARKLENVCVLFFTVLSGLFMLFMYFCWSRRVQRARMPRQFSSPAVVQPAISSKPLQRALGDYAAQGSADDSFESEGESGDPLPW